MIPLLITSAINANAPLTALKDSKLRLEVTLIALEKWGEICPDLPIVICDGTGFDFSGVESLAMLPNTIECLTFRNNENVVRYRGKGYGEGEIINFALKHSNLLSQYSHFAKCTSKLWIENFHKLFQANLDAEFLGEIRFRNFKNPRTISVKRVDTRFYISSKKFYNEYLRDAHMNVCDEKGYFLEHAFKDALILSGKRISRMLFSQAPYIYGISGTRGESESGDYRGLSKRTKRLIGRANLHIQERFLR